MNFSNLKIGTRLGMGFGVMLVSMMILVGISMQGLSGIGKANEDVIDRDWINASAAASITAVTRHTSALLFESLVNTDPARTEHITLMIDENRKATADAIAVMEKLLVRPERKAALAEVKERRAAFVDTFTAVRKLIADNQREQATAMMFSDTIPKLNSLQDSVKKLSDLEREAVDESGAQVKQTISTERTVMLGLGTAVLLAGIAFAVLTTRSITRPIAYALKVARAVAAGDLTSRIETTRQDETGQLLLALKEMNASLSTIVGEVRLGTGTIATASSEIASGNQDLSSRTEAQASALEETASSMIELTTTVRQNSDNARQADALAQSASAVALRGGSVVSQVVDTMESINASSKKIVDIIGVIDGIAFQTNILALNAAVEAARAGEQGRGFAVVASEVRNLAQRSAAAAKEIKALIADSVDKVDAGAQLVGQAGSTMDEVVSSVARVSAIVAEISLASHEQSDGIEQINQAIGQLDSATQQNAALVEQAAAAAISMHEQADALEQVVGRFKLDHEAGKPAMRAAPPRRPAREAQRLAA
jgi:methyl-accepting chemotaxis protein